MKTIERPGLRTWGRLLGIGLLLGLGTLASPGRLAAQDRVESGWRFGANLGLMRVDELAGTPLVPSIDFHKNYGSTGIVGGTLHWIRDAGFYGLDALVLDLGMGFRSSSRANHVAVLFGPTAIVGGDGDGTPYTGVGARVAVQGTRWLGEHVGISAGATGRVWFTTANSRFMPDVRIGVSFR